MSFVKWASFLVVLVLSMACVITNYPVITDTRGADAGAVMQSFYDKALIMPSFQVAILWPDGSDELFSDVTQDWKGDQWIYTYNNFDPTQTVEFLDQTYCDPVHGADCWIARAWNPDLPEWDPWDWPQQPEPPLADNVWDYEADWTCTGARSISDLGNYSSRLGECGSGLWADKQGLAYEFSLLARASWRGHEWYHVPVDASVASFVARGADGSETPVPVYGRFNLYVDERTRTVLPITPNAKYELRWLDQWMQQHGARMDLEVTYGSLTTTFATRLLPMKAAIDRL